MGGIIVKISAKAKDYRNERLIYFGVYRNVDEGDLEDAFIDGAQWMQSELIEKAVGWLKKNAQNYYEDSAMHENCWFDDEQMIKDFQKALEE